MYMFIYIYTLYLPLRIGLQTKIILEIKSIEA